MDLFTHDDEAFQKADDLTKQAGANLDVACKPVRVTSYFKHFRVGPKDDPLTIHFSKDHAAHIKPLSQFDISEIPSFMIKPLTANELKQYRDTTIDWLILKSTPPLP